MDIGNTSLNDIMNALVTNGASAGLIAQLNDAMQPITFTIDPTLTEQENIATSTAYVHVRLKQLVDVQVSAQAYLTEF